MLQDGSRREHPSYHIRSSSDFPTVQLLVRARRHQRQDAGRRLALARYELIQGRLHRGGVEAVASKLS